MSYVTNSYIRSSEGGAGRRYEGRHGFSFSYIMGDPFALSTISISIVGWIIAFAGCVTMDVSKSNFPTLTWWGVVFQFFIILGVILIVGYDSLYPYQLALIAFLAVAIVYTTNSTNNFVWNATPASAAVAAGHILLSIINILWVFYFGTSSDEPVHAFVDSFSVNGGVSTGGSTYSRGGTSLPRHSGNPFSRGDAIGMTYAKPPPLGAAGQRAESYPQMFTSAQLGAFENSEQKDHDESMSYVTRSSLGPEYPSGVQSDLSSPIVYPYKAKAIYSYEANPEDKNELSFTKGEILEVSDITGRWWQARRANGQVGICPSNYVLLEGNVER